VIIQIVVCRTGSLIDSVLKMECFAELISTVQSLLKNRASDLKIIKIMQMKY